MTDHLPAVRHLISEGHGDRHIAGALGVTRHVARGLMNKLKLEDARGSLEILGDVGTPTGLYETACRALAAAVRVDEVKSVLDVSVALKAYARQAKNRDLEANAVVLRERGERCLGEILIEAKKVGQIAEGRPGNGSEKVPFPRVTLAEADIDKKLSARAQKKAGISQRAYEAMLDSMRSDILAGRRGVDVLKSAPINGARSVMGSRFEPDDSLDYFPTPPWATRSLFDVVLSSMLGAWDAVKPTGEFYSAWEPACGEGHMSEVLKEYFGEVWASDIFDYSPGATGDHHDFLSPDIKPRSYDWIITNPPFGDNTIPFILRAIELARVGVAMFLRLQILETIERYEKIFKPHPPTLIAFFAERVNLCKGRWDPDGGTATAYCWLVWMKDRAPMAPFWIPPGQREALTRPDDRVRFAAWSMPHDPETGEVTEAAE